MADVMLHVIAFSTSQQLREAEKSSIPTTLLHEKQYFPPNFLKLWSIDAIFHRFGQNEKVFPDILLISKTGQSSEDYLPTLWSFVAVKKQPMAEPKTAVSEMVA